MMARLITLYCLIVTVAVADAQTSDQDQQIGDVHNMEPITGSWNPLRTQEGYVFGLLSQVASRGFIIKTLEGDVKLGVTSSTGGFLDQSCYDREYDQRQARSAQPLSNDERSRIRQNCIVPINPWHFSSYDTNLLAWFEKVRGEPVLLFFRTYAYLPIVETNNYFAQVYLSDPEVLPPGSSYVSQEDTLTSVLHYGRGFAEGRIVKAALDGVVRKTFELIIQVGNSGNVFKAISISDEELFKFALKAMSTGRYLKIEYYQMYSPLAVPVNLLLGYNTDLRAYRIEVLDDPKSGMGTPP